MIYLNHNLFVVCLLLVNLFAAIVCETFKDSIIRSGDVVLQVMFTYNCVFIVILHSSHTYPPEDKVQSGNFHNRVTFPLESGS